MTESKANNHAHLADTHGRLRAEFLELYGPVVGGADLVRALGYSNAAAFRQTRRQGRISLNIFTLPARRGSFALSTDVADWLIAARQTGKEKDMP